MKPTGVGIGQIECSQYGKSGEDHQKKVILIKKNNSSKKIKIIKNKFKEMKEKEGRKERREAGTPPAKRHMVMIHSFAM